MLKVGQVKMNIFTFLGLSLLAVAIAIIGWSLFLVLTVSAWQILLGKTLIIIGNVVWGGVVVLFLSSRLRGE